MRRHLLPALAAVLIVACGIRSDEESDSSAGAATAGHWIQANSPYFWVDSTYDELTKASTELGAPPLAPPLADSSPLVVRLQQWADRFDVIVRRAMEERFHAPLAAPKPVIKVVPAWSTFNAWVSSIPGQIGDAPTDADAGAVPSITWVEENVVWAPEPFASAVKPAAWQDTRAFVKLWNGARARCRVEVSGSTFTFSGAECVGAGTYAGPIVLTGGSPYVHVSTDLLEQFDDEATAALVVAHELGHYYRGHVSTLPARKYEFWYSADPSAPRRPVPSESAAAYAVTYREILSAPEPVAEGALKSRYSARLRHLLIGPLADALRRQFADMPAAPCADAVAKLGPWTGQLALNGATPTGEVRSSFVAYEEALSSCSANIKITRRSSPDDFYIGWLDRNADYRALGAPRIEERQSLADLLGELDRRASSVDVKSDRFIAELQQNHIGLYTTEQEADELALEFMTRAGFSGDEVLQAWLGFIRANDAFDAASLITEEERAAMRARPGYLDAPSCGKLLANDFMDVGPNGERTPHLMILGRLDEPHHASCYRLYNLWREQRAQRYLAGPRSEPLSPPWAALQTVARIATDAALEEAVRAAQAAQAMQAAQQDGGVPEGGPSSDGGGLSSDGGAP